MNDAVIIQKLRELLHDSQCYGKVEPRVIERAEQALGVTFPRDYRIFLGEFGACYGGDRPEISGLSERDLDSTKPDQLPEWSSVVQDTLGVRRVSGGSLPASYIVISSDGQDCTLCLDTSGAIRDEECPVIALGPGRDNERYAESFLSFVAGEA